MSAADDSTELILGGGQLSVKRSYDVVLCGVALRIVGEEVWSKAWSSLRSSNDSVLSVFDDFFP